VYKESRIGKRREQRMNTRGDVHEQKSTQKKMETVRNASFSKNPVTGI